MAQTKTSNWSHGAQAAPAAMKGAVTQLHLPHGVTLYFVRHGETDWNKAQRYQGQTDIPLNDTGRAQATGNGARLKDLLGSRAGDVHFVASPLLRTAETMERLRTAMGLAPNAFARDGRLVEQHFGHWEGQLWSDLPALDPEGVAARRADTWHWTPRGGENYGMVEARVRPWLESIDRDTVCVSHGNISRTVRGVLLGLDKSEVPRLEVPQDRVLRIVGGTAVWV
jgi:broad specificity phosphatase PhoE